LFEAPEQKRRRAGSWLRNQRSFVRACVYREEVMDYFNTNHPYTKQAKSREILTEYVNSQQQGANNGN
jgi:hypothetical protein